MAISQHRASEITDFLARNQADILFLLFIGNCCLLDKQQSDLREANKIEEIVENYSTSAAHFLCPRSKDRVFKESLKQMIKDGLKSPLPIPFEELLKAFIEKSVNTKLSSLVRSITTLINLVTNLRNNNYQINYEIKKGIASIRAEWHAQSNELSEKEIISHVMKRKDFVISGKMQVFLDKHDTWKSLFIWAKEQDDTVNENVRNLQDRFLVRINGIADKLATSSVVITTISVALMVGNSVFKGENAATDLAQSQPVTNIEQQGNLASEERPPIIDKSSIIYMAGLIVILTMVGIYKFAVSIFAQEAKFSVDSYKHSNQTAADTMDNALERFFNLQLIEYYPIDVVKHDSKETIENKIKEGKQEKDQNDQPQFVLQLAPQAANTLANNFSNDHNDNADRPSYQRERAGKKRKVKSIQTISHNATNEDKSKKVEISNNRFVNTQSHIIRYMTSDKFKSTLVLDRNALKKAIPDKTMRHSFFRAFQNDVPKRLSKEQFEFTTSYNERLFGHVMTVNENETQRTFTQPENMNNQEVIIFDRVGDGLRHR